VLSMTAAWWVSRCVSTPPITDRFFAAMLVRSALLGRVENTWTRHRSGYADNTVVGASRIGSYQVTTPGR
jgi:hypothetical protein